jgi:hypothetical protein
MNLVIEEDFGLGYRSRDQSEEPAQTFAPLHQTILACMEVGAQHSSGDVRGKRPRKRVLLVALELLER